MLAVTPAQAQVADQTSLQTWAQGLAPHSQLYLPDGPGPHPVVIYMHGCKRLQSHADLWGHALSANGYAVLALIASARATLVPLSKSTVSVRG